MLMLAEYGTLSLAEVLAPSIELADGYPIEAETADRIERWRDKLKEWPYSKQVMLPHLGEAREAPHPGEIFRQPDLAATLRKLVEAEAAALKAGKSRKEAIQAAYDRFYRGDIAEEFVRSVKEQGGLITLADLDQLARRSSRSRSRRTTAASTSTSSTPGRRARRCCSRSTCSRTSTSRRWATTAPTTSTPCTRR